MLDDDPARAREAARKILGFLRDAEGGYPKHFRRMGFTEDDVTRLSDRLVDALVAWGGLDTVAGRVSEHHAAGADQVALNILPTGEGSVAIAQCQQLATALLS